MSQSSAASTQTSRTSQSLAHSIANSIRSSSIHNTHGTTQAGGGGGGSRHRLKPATRQDSRLGITTDYVDLSLHSAAAKGNVGLVQYALSHGQPVNSVLNGLLPLHAGASSGNETVVRMLIEAGADVNSPRLPRRYTNERTKSSGLAAGTQGSTPLHFAAANGHVSIIKLLLSYGANPQAAEKHGLLPEAIALQQGHIEAADVLKTWQPYSPERGFGNGSQDDAASIRSRSSLRSLSKKRLHPQRSFDAIATKIAQHAHAHPHLHSSASLVSLTSLGSSVSPNASSSQISLGAATGPSPVPIVSSTSSSSGSHVNRRSSLSHPSLGLTKDPPSSSSHRRPSLPSVWEKAAHPRATIRHALGMSNIRSGSGGSAAKGGMGSDSETRRALAEWANASRSSLGSSTMAEDYALAEEDEEDVEEDESPEREGDDEKEERRRSMEVHRPLRMSSFTKSRTLDSTSTPPASAPPTQTTFSTSDLNSLTSTTSTLRPDRSPTLSRAPSASKHEMYRPRMSSQLSMGSESEANPTETVATVEGGGDGEGGPDKTVVNRQRSVSNPQPESRSPLLQQLHQNLLDDAAATSPFLYSASSTTSSPASSRRPSTGATAGLADHELSSDGSAASRFTRPTPADVRRAFAVHQGRDRANSVESSTTSSSFSRPPTAPSPAPPPPVLQTRAEANRNRSDSTASSLSNTSFAGTNFSYAGTSSTAPTSVAPSSPGARAEQFLLPGGKTTRLPSSNLAPLYESKHPSSTSTPTTTATSTTTTLSAGGRGGVPITSQDKDLNISRAQARSRVQKAERDLLSYQPSSSKTSNASSSGASKLSLREQLALYGKSLAIEREVVAREEDEREKKTSGGYRIETIGSSTKSVPSSPPTKSSSTSVHSSPTVTSIPAWRAVPTVDRLMPPPSNLHIRHSVSPPGTPRRQQPKDNGAASGFEPAPAAPSSSNAKVPMATTVSKEPHGKEKEQDKDSSSSPMSSDKIQSRRPSSPTSLSGSTTSNNGPTVPSAGGAVLGTGLNGVHFVEVAREPHHHHHHHHHGRTSKSHGRGSDRSHSDKGGGATSSVASGTVLSVRDQVEEERKEQARREASIPRAVITSGGGKKKGIKGWFGGAK